MGILQSLRALMRGQALPSPRNGLSFGRIIPGSDIDVSPIDSKKEAAETYAGWVYAASTFIAEEVRALEWSLYRRTSVRMDEWEVDARHAFNDVLATPNSRDGWGDFIERSAVSFNVAGEVFWHVTRNLAGGPIGLEVVLPHWVDDPIFDREGKHVAWRVTIPGYTHRDIPVEDIIRVYRPHPLDPWMAASTVEAAAVSHYFDLYLRAYGMTLFRNDGGIPAGLLKTDQALSPEQATSMREVWRQRYSQQRGEVAVLGEGLEYQQLGISMQDLKFMEVGEFTRSQVLSLYRVPAALLGEAQDVNRASIDGHLYSFQRHALRPLAKRFEDAINHRVIPIFINTDRRSYSWAFENVVAKDRTAIREEAGAALAAGATTINEYRQRLDLDPIPNGDVYTLPTKMQIFDTLQPKAPEPPEPPENPDRGLEARLMIAAAQRRADAAEEQAKALRVEQAERRTYQALRSLFAGWWRDRTGDTIPMRGLEDHNLTVKDLPDVDDGETLLEWIERLKGPEGKRLAALSVERSTL